MNRYEMLCRADRHAHGLLSGVPFRSVQCSDPMPPYVSPAAMRILAAIAELRFACSERLALYIGITRRSVDRYLENLRSKHLVSWFRFVEATHISAGIGPINSKCVYCLTPLGTARCLLDGVLEDDRHVVQRKWRGRPSIHGLIMHHLGIVDIILGLRRAERKSDTHKILWTLPDFVTEKINGKRLMATIEPIGKSVCRPDMVALLAAKERGEFTLYFEYERHSKDGKLIAEKFEKYTRLFTGKRRFDKGSPILLYVIADCKHQEDTEKRKKFVRDIAAEYKVSPAVRIACLSDVIDDAFGTVWTKINGDAWSIGPRQ